MDDTTLMTAADHAALTAELAELEGEGRREIAQRIKTAREWGDLKENSEYHDAKNDQAHLETKIAVLRERLARAKVVEVSTAGRRRLASARACTCATRTAASSASRSSARSRGARAGQDLHRIARRPRAARLAGRRRGDGRAPSREPPLHGRTASSDRHAPSRLEPPLHGRTARLTVTLPRGSRRYTVVRLD